MKPRRAWKYIGRVFSDPCPGLSDFWDVYIARTKDNRFFILKSGSEDDFEVGSAKEAFEVGSAKEAAEWIRDESCLFDICEVAECLEGIRGYATLVHHLLEG